MRALRSANLAYAAASFGVVCLCVALETARAEGPAPLRKIGEMELSLVGLSARVEPARPVVPKNVASGVRIVVVAGGQELGADEVERLLGGAFEARAELLGPGLGGALELRTAATDPDPLLLPLPPLPLAGDYDLSNVRLVAPARTLDVAPTVPVQVIDQILVTSVKTRALTLDEIREKGIVLDSDDYLGFEFTLGLKFESKPIDFKFPVVFDREGVVVPEFLKPPAPPFREGVLSPTFLPMLLEASGPEGEGGVREKIPLSLPGGGGPIRIPSVVVIPGNVAFLKQFFSAQLFVANGAPGGSGLVVRNVVGKLKLPPGQDGVTSPPGSSADDLGDDPLSLPKVLRNGETITQPSELPLRGLGPDAEPGTADDLDALPPAAQGQAEFLIRGEKEGYHTVDFDLTATLDGLAIGPVKVSGKAQGGLLVRNASFDMTFTVPGVVRAGERFKLFATLTNVGKGPGNKVEVALDGLGLAGVSLAPGEDDVKVIDTLLPGDAQTVEFLFDSEVTGQVVASYLDFDDKSTGGTTVTGRMRFTLGVGERGIPLSPDTLVLPTAVDDLVNPDTPVGQPSVVDAAMRVLGQAWSIANAPSGSLPKGVLRTSKAVVTQKALALAEAGLRLRLGQDREDAVRDLAFDFFGGAPLDPGFDQLLRQTEAGRRLVAVLGRELAAPATELGLPAFEEQVARFAASGADFATFAVGAGAANPFTVSLEDRRGRRTETAGDGLPPWAVPGAALLPLGEGEAPPLLGLVTAPNAPPYILHLRGRDPGAADVAVTFPDGKGGFVRAVLFGLEVPVGGEALVVFDPARPGSVRLERDDDGDGVFVREIVETTALLLQGPALVSARVIGPEVLAGASPLGNQVAILFDRVVDEKAAADVAKYGMVDNSVRVARRQLSGRLVFGALERPEGPYVPARLSVDGMKDTRGIAGSGGEVDLLSLLVEPGAVVSGRVLTALGEPVTPGSVVYMASSIPKGVYPCRPPAGVAAVPLDTNGRYELRYVRQDPCGPFSIVTQDPATDARSEVRASVRAAGERIELDIVLFGRGSVAGQVRARASGQPIAGAKVVAYSVTDPQIGGAATTDALGKYLVPGITVGPVSVRAAKGIAAGLGAGRIDRAGTTATVDVLLDTGSVKWSGVVRSKKGSAQAVTLPGVQVVYYVDNTPVGVTRTDTLGAFAFPAMPAGNTKVRAVLTANDTAEVTRVTAEGDVIVQDLLIVIPEDAELGTVRGVVRFADGQRAGGVLVRAGNRAAVTSRPTDGVPDTGGEFVILGLPLGEVYVGAESPDGKRSGSARVALSAAARDVATAITLSGLGTAVFTVVDPLGQPVKDAHVRLADCADDPCGCTSGRTLADGTVEFPNLKVGTVHAKAFFENDVTTGSASVTRDGDRAVGLMRLGGTGAVFGIVLDHRGLPALGADLEVYSKVFVNDGISTCGLKPGISHRYRTREDGKFRFTGISAGQVSVTASQAFYPTRVGQQVVLLHGRTEGLTLRLVNTMAGVFTGLVYLPDGESLAGRGVEVTADGPLPEVVVKTDDTGRFRFAKILPEGLYTVTVRDPVTGGMVRESIYLRANEPAERDFRLKGKGEVRVRVVDGADQPVESAFVRLREEEFPNRTFERALGPSNQGVAVFPNVFEGPVSLEASDSFSRGGRASTVLPGPGRVVEATVRLTVTGRVTGRFRRPDSSPIPLGVVRLFVAGRPFGQITTSSATEDEGRFAFDYVPAGAVVLEAQDPLTARTGRATGSLASEGEVLVLDVFAQALGTVEGLVTSNDAPQPGALVEVTSGTFVATTDTDGEGRYRMQGVPGGRVVAKASLAAGFLAGTAGGDLTQDDSVLGLDVALRGSARVRGSVVAYDGSHPLSRVTIRSGGLGGATLATLTDANGLYEVDRVPAGPAEILADVLDSIDQAARSVTVPEGGVLDVPPLDLPGLGTVEVRVVDALGQAVEAASVLVVDPGGQGRSGSLGGGVARFPQVRAGVVTARAWDANQRAGAKTATLAPGATLQVEVPLNPTFTLSGQVRERTGEPAPAGVEVTLRGPSYAKTATLDEGRFSFPFVPVGAFQLEAQTAAGDRGQLGGVVLETGVAPVVVALNGAGRVELEVVDFAGQKVAEAQVQLSTQGSIPDLQYGKTGVDGVAAFPSVLRGPLTANAYARGTRALVTASWQDGQPVQRLLATLPQQGRIEGKVLNPAGTTGVPGVTILLGYASTASGPEGAFAFENVALGTHALTARVNGRLRASRDGIAVTSGAPVQTDQDLVLIGAAKVKGRVRNSQGQFGSGATVTLKSPVVRYGGTFTATTSGAGQYEIADVPVGPFSLTATLGSERVDLLGLAMPDPAVDQEVSLELVADLADLETYLYDGNGFRYQIGGDGSLKDLQGRSFVPGAPRLVITRGGVASPFAGSSDRYVPSEGGRRELRLRQEGLAGLDVTRKVFVPNDGHFIRYLEVIENPTSSAVLLDEVAVETELNDSGYPTAGLVGTATGDGALDAADGWVVLDDKPGAAEDPDIFVNYWRFAPLASVFADPTRPGAPSVSFAGGTLVSRHASVTVPAQGRVAFLHAYSVRATRTGAAASAARLLGLPPELLQGLSRDEAQAVRNFRIEVGPGPEDGPLSLLAPLPPNDGKVSGTVRASDNATPLLMNGQLRPRNPFLDRPVALRSASDGTFEARANLVAEAPPTKVLVPRGDYDLVFEQISPAVLAATANASGTFAPGSSVSTRDVVFSQTGFVSGTVKRASGAAVASARVILKAASGAPGATAEVLADGFGAFRFPVVPPGSYTLQAVLPAGGATTPVVPVVVGTGVQPPVPLVFPAFGSISGTMRNHAGQGLTSCSAQIVVSGTSRTTTCGAGGAYGFVDVPPDTYVVGVRDHRSQVPLTQTVTVLEGPATLVPDFRFPPVGTVKVTVRSQDGPLKFALVYRMAPALGTASTFVGYTGTGTIPGGFTITNVPGSGVVIEAVHPQSTHVRKTSAPLEIAFDGQEVGTLIELPAPVRLEGVFRTKDGRTVAALQATARSLDGLTTYATANAVGQAFVLPSLPPLPLRLRGQALSPAWFTAEKEIDLSAASGTVTADALLPYGRIAATGGRDLWEFATTAGASVNVRLLGEADGAVPAPEVVVQVVGPDGSVHAKGETPATKDAILTFTAPVTGSYVAIVSARGAQAGLYRLGSSSSLLVFREYAGGLVTGKVVREGPAPVVGLRVALASLPGRPFAITGPNGEYLFPAVLPGPATVEAIDAEGVVIGTIAGEGALPDLVVPGRGTVTATATRLGAALAGLQVRFTSDHGTALADDKARQRATSATGVATALLPVGLVRAEATDPVRGILVTSEAKALSDGGSVDLPLLFPDARTLVTGTVRNGDGGVAVPCGRVDLLLAGVLTKVAFCDANGAFSLPLVQPGSYTLTARYGSFASVPVSLSLPQGAATSVTVDLNLAMPVLRARVVEPPPGGALAPAQVWADCGTFWQYLTLQPDGTHLYFGRPCGTLTAFTVTGILTDGSGLEVSQPATYETGFMGTRDVTLTLPPTGTVQVNVTDTDGANVTVRFTDSAGLVRHLAGDGGSFTFARVRTGPANVVVTDDYGVSDDRGGDVQAGETLVFDLSLAAGNLDLSLAQGGTLFAAEVFVDALDGPLGPLSRSVYVYDTRRWRVPAGAFRVRFLGGVGFDLNTEQSVDLLPAAFEGEVALGQTVAVPLQAGSHVALPTTLGGYQAELGGFNLRNDPSSFVRTTVHPNVEPFVSPALLEHDGKGLRDLALVGQGLRMRRVRYVPVSSAFVRTLTLIENHGPATTACVQSLLAELADSAGAAVVASSDGNAEFDATDSWVVVQNGDHLFAAVFGALPGAQTGFEPGDCGDGCSPTLVRVDHPLEIASGEGETQTVAILAFALWQPGAQPDDLDAIVARARALSDLSFAGALADLSPAERDAIVNFVVPAFGGLEGVVEDAAGARVPGARVFAMRGGLVAAEVEADAGAGDPGAFAIGDLPVGDYSLVAVHPATNRPGRLPVATVLEGVSQDAGVVTLLDDAQVGVVRVEGVLEGTTDPAEGASVRLDVEGFSPAWSPVQVLGPDGAADFTEVPAGVPAEVRGAGAWVAVPPQDVEAVGGVSTTVAVVLRYEQATSLPADLSAGGRSYFVQSNGAVQVDGGAFAGNFAVAEGQWFPDSPGVLRHGGREVEVGPAAVGPVTVARRVYVPPSGAFARLVDVIRNPTGADVTLFYELQRYLWSGEAGDFEVFEKSGPAPEVGSDDDWLVVRVPGGPVFGLVLGGAGRPSRPESASWWASGGSAALTEGWWNANALVVPANGLVVLVQFVVPGAAGTEVQVRDQTQSLSALADPEGALFGLTAEEKAALVNWVP